MHTRANSLFGVKLTLYIQDLFTIKSWSSLLAQNWIFSWVFPFRRKLFMLILNSIRWARGLHKSIKEFLLARSFFLFECNICLTNHLDRLESFDSELMIMMIKMMTMILSSLNFDFLMKVEAFMSALGSLTGFWNQVALKLSLSRLAEAKGMFQVENFVSNWCFLFRIKNLAQVFFLKTKRQIWVNNNRSQREAQFCFSIKREF